MDSKSDKERRDVAWDLGLVALVFACAVGLWGIADTGTFEGTPLVVFGNFWLTLGLACVVGGLIIAPRTWVHKDGKGNEEER